MDKLRALQYLVKVADTLSFSRAAKAFGVPASSISRRITDLEADLGVQLLHRTTRTVRLTEVGALYLEQVRAGIAQLNDAEELVAQRSNTPSGTLRISTMPGYGRLLLLPALQDFGERYPQIVLDVHLSDTLVDLGRDQIDIAIRGGRQPQDRVVARKLDPNRFILAASPQYLATMGTPRTLDDLQGHRALMYRGPNAVIPWQGLDEEGWREIPVTPAFISNDGASHDRHGLPAPWAGLAVGVGLERFPATGRAGASHARPAGVGQPGRRSWYLPALPADPLPHPEGARGRRIPDGQARRWGLRQRPSAARG